ncbi:two-component regulator propeller domain-containing protein [Siphonobacter sp. SORGH_AS_1065]|uniref:ligand-binding sensor domain-containing protein n=1 Tax=Siphonobacter sp. SORGH_AS_1065 TaxID=3041795 RepID=UPI00277DB4B2|nr:two-component regulator propeller domain-containing protein [Siphonobacter sp. SORGH_AS_1065]MDQ1088915.1 ligand-binding sensor domain-containing protein [Siphonobacter sp. SORGH_AS_1065]
MMNGVPVFALFLMLVFCTSCRQDQKDTIKSEDSITSQVPNSMVRNVKQDRNGNILIASYKGVFRYDGKSFVNLTSTISSPSFWDVLEDRKGNLWFATRDSGVYYYNGNLLQHFIVSEGLASNQVSSIYEDKTGMIWFATGGGLSRLDGKSFRNFTTKDGLPANAVTTIMEDRSGKLWIGTTGEACFYDGKTFTIFRNKEGKAFSNVRGFAEDKRGNIWFGATTIMDRKGDSLMVRAGLWCYDGSIFTQMNQRGTSSILEDKKGNIWTTSSVNPNGVGAWKLLRYDQKSLSGKKPVATEIISIDKMLCAVLEAHEGSIWFGSINGVYRYDGKNIIDFKSKKGQ